MEYGHSIILICMEITCYRDRELSREPHTLPSHIYNLSKNLMKRSPSRVVFVPIRSMQYLAIIDREEFIFVDSQHRNWIEIAWQHFRPGTRTSLDEPVPYEAVIYHPDGYATMSRLMNELPKALHALANRERVDGPARILKFERHRET